MKPRTDKGEDEFKNKGWYSTEDRDNEESNRQRSRCDLLGSRSFFSSSRMGIAID